MYYSNGYTSTFEELISHYPTFYREILEMRAILEAQGGNLDTATEEINRVIENSFIDTADNDTIQRLEEFLHITPDATSTFDDRRRNVKLYFTGFGKISASKLKEMLYPFTETESTISFNTTDNNGNKLLSIIIPRGEKEHFSSVDVMKLLSRRIPAHLWYGVTIDHAEKNGLFFGTAMVYVKEMNLPSVSEDVSLIVYLADESEDTLTDENGNILIL